MEKQIYDLVITKKHCEGRFFGNDLECAVCAAVAEQTDLKRFSSGVESGWVWADNRVVVYQFDKKFGCEEFNSLNDGKIQSFNLRLTKEKLNSEQKDKKCDATTAPSENPPPAPKEVHHYYRIPNDVIEELKEMSVPEILDSN